MVRKEGLFEELSFMLRIGSFRLSLPGRVGKVFQGEKPSYTKVLRWEKAH